MYADDWFLAMRGKGSIAVGEDLSHLQFAMYGRSLLTYLKTDC
jgi:hypothetical protein